jgi:hypothetical protein
MMDAETFSKIAPVGTPVRYYPIRGQQDYFNSRIRSEAWRLDDGHVVVLIERKTGGVAINHLEIASGEEKKAVGGRDQQKGKEMSEDDEKEEFPRPAPFEHPCGSEPEPEPSCLDCLYFVRVKMGSYPKAHCLKHFVARNSDGYKEYLQLPGRLDGKFTQHCEFFDARKLCPFCGGPLGAK